LYGKGLSATDISNALNLQNLILPTGTVKVGTREYLIRLNSSPALISAMNEKKTLSSACNSLSLQACKSFGYSIMSIVPMKYP
jgi:multidrug efflux pump subunit AcrB